MLKRLLQSSKQETGVNMTPLIDVSLVLVVILLLATPFALESSIAVQRSRAAAGKASPDEKKLEYVDVAVVSEDSVRVNRRSVARADLLPALVPLLERSARRQVVVRCEDAVSHGTFVDVLDLAKLAGAGEIAVMGR